MQPKTTKLWNNKGLRKKIASIVIVGVLGLLGLNHFQPYIEQVLGTDTSVQSTTTSAQPANPELSKTLALIQQGGPFPYRQDGTVFQNREGLLPDKPRGYYHEYTVDTPGLNHRGARRVVTGGNPPAVYYYTEDHYQSFITLEVTP